MSASGHFESQQFVPLPRDEVFAFFADAANLETITPAYLQFRMLTPLPIEMKAGALIEYRLKLYGVPIRWKTRIESFDPPRKFTDIQLRGPYALWYHEHEFLEVDGGTMVVDRVDYKAPLGPLGWIAERLFVRRSVEGIFAYRRDRIAAMFATDPVPA